MRERHGAQELSYHSKGVMRRKSSHVIQSASRGAGVLMSLEGRHVTQEEFSYHIDGRHVKCETREDEEKECELGRASMQQLQQQQQRIKVCMCSIRWAEIWRHY